MNRRDVILGRQVCFFCVDRANPIVELFLRRDLAAQQGVIEVAMRVNQTGEQDLLAEIQVLSAIAGSHLFERADVRYLISGNCDRAILNRLAHPIGSYHARTNNHGATGRSALRP